MKRISFLLFACALLFIAPVAAQTSSIAKKSLAISDFANWKVLSGQSLSADGKYVAFEVNPQKGDGKLVLKMVDGSGEKTFARGYAARFAPGSDFIVYKIKQPADSLREAKKKKLKKEQMPKDSIGVFVFKSQKKYSFPKLKQFTVPDESGQWISFLVEMKNAKKTEEKTTAKKDEASDEQKYRLVLFDTASGDTVCYDNVSEYYHTPQGRRVMFIRQGTVSLAHSEALVFDTSTRATTSLFKEIGTAKKITADKQGNRFGFLFSPDTIKTKVYSLYSGAYVHGAKAVASPGQNGVPSGWSPSEFGDLSFSDNGLRLYFGTNREPVAEPKDTLIDEEKPMLDIWTWKDAELQPEQKANLEKEKKRNYRAVYLTDKGKTVQLADLQIRDVRTIQKGNGATALGIDQSPYKLESSWTGKSNADYYLIDIATGIKRMIVSNKAMASLSPAGNFVIWYNPDDSCYYSRSTNINSLEEHNLTAQVQVMFCDERSDAPIGPSPYGIAGWAENDKYVYVYDRYDIWRLDPEGKKVPVSATQSYGRDNLIRFKYQRLDPEEEFININKPVIVSAFDERDKSSGYFSVDLKNCTEPRRLLMGDYRYENLQKAKKADVVVWTGENVSESPTLWSATTEFDEQTRLSDTNPQQNQFVWSNVKLVRWQSFSGKKLEGLLYYPETLDVEKKYPMIVYFYERNADNLHAYSAPSPSRSTVNRTFLTSNDYIVFIPDITYTEGYPGQSAFDAIISGTQFICNEFRFIDREKIGIQGQSWGGYQTAWLITQTNMFAAAMAGAPVSNMTSAYGGIRWESGLSRMYQYENTQSRIGATLWERPLRYIENSPLFYAPKIQTPLLIMHNDNDGAVPWYQGIELFTAMRRLSKPVWMLVYNNEEHNLKAESWANRTDLTIRMQQFFDHYLKNANMPPWMLSGLPTIKKGKESGY